MDWLIVTLGVLIAFGGIVYVLPSRNDRLRGNARLRARRVGMTVSSSTIPNLNAANVEKVTAGGRRRNPTHLGFVYFKNYLDDLDNLPNWQIVPNMDSTHPIAGWTLQPFVVDEVFHLDNEYWRAIEDLCASAPRRCLGIRCNEIGVAWIGVEDLREHDVEGFVDDVEGFLDRLADLNTRHAATRNGTMDERAE